MTFQDSTVESKNYYQFKKIKLFLKNLQKGLFLESFENHRFESLVGIPVVRLEKLSRKEGWVVTVFLLEELFYYTYPFTLPDLFKTKLLKDEFEVCFYFFQQFCSVN